MRRIILFAAAAAGLLAPATAQAQSKWAKHYADRVAEFRRENARLDTKKQHVVLLGSSSMEGWKYGKRLKRFLPGVPALNRGISADTIGRGRRGVLHRLKASVYDARPSHVFLLNGRNDLGRSAHPPVAATAATYEKVIVAIQRRLPKTVVCVVTCAPVNKTYKVMHPHLLQLNAALRKLAKKHGCPLIDLHRLLRGSDGLLPLSLTRDGLHFTDEGYEVLGQEIQRVLRQHPTRKPAKTTNTPKKTPPKKTAKKTKDEDASCPRAIGGSVAALEQVAR